MLYVLLFVSIFWGGPTGTRPSPQVTVGPTFNDLGSCQTAASSITLAPVFQVPLPLGPVAGLQRWINPICVSLGAPSPRAK